MRLPFLRKSHLVVIKQLSGNVGARFFWWWDALPHTNQLGLGKRCWNLETSSAVAEFYSPYNYPEEPSFKSVNWMLMLFMLYTVEINIHVATFLRRSSGLPIAARRQTGRFTPRKRIEKVATDAGSVVERSKYGRPWCAQPTISGRKLLGFYIAIKLIDFRTNFNQNLMLKCPPFLKYLNSYKVSSIFMYTVDDAIQ